MPLMHLGLSMSMRFLQDALLSPKRCRQSSPNLSVQGLSYGFSYSWSMVSTALVSLPMLLHTVGANPAINTDAGDFYGGHRIVSLMRHSAYHFDHESNSFS